jgi:hypothetical protein
MLETPTSPPFSRWICARCPSYLNSMRNGAPAICATASGMPSQILASIGFSGMPDTHTHRIGHLVPIWQPYNLVLHNVQMGGFLMGSYTSILFPL